MKTALQQLCLWAFPVVALLGSDTMLGQIDYGEDFSAGAQKWTNNSFEATSVAACNGAGALRARISSYVPQDDAAVAVSPSIGISNGEEMTLTYSYKLLNYDSVQPAVPVDAVDFGAVRLQYATSINGPWNELDYIDLANYEPSADCVERMVNFTPPEGSNVYLRLNAARGTALGLDYFVYLENINAIQSVLTVEDRNLQDALVAYPNPVTDYLILDYDRAISGVAIYNMQGQEVNAWSLDNDFRRLDMTGLASGTYVVKVFGATEIQSVNVVKY